MKGFYSFLAGLASAFGIAWLYNNNPEFRKNVDSIRDQVRDRAQSLQKAARETTEEAADTVSRAAEPSSRSAQRNTSTSADAARRAIFTGSTPRSRGAASGATSEQPKEPTIDLNNCSREDLVRIGLAGELADRVVENRPYRNKLDLVSRLVIPEDIYVSIKHSIGVDGDTSTEPVKVAAS